MSKGPELVIIRKARPADGTAIAEIYRPFVSETIVSFETDPPSPETVTERIRTILRTHPYLVAEDAGRILGYAYASKHRERAAYQWSADVSVYIHPDFHRRGVGKALYAELLSRLRHQGFHTAFAGITLPNAASVGLHESLGFGLVGIYREVGYKLGGWHDVGWWGLTLSPAAVPATPPGKPSA